MVEIEDILDQIKRAMKSEHPDLDIETVEIEKITFDFYSYYWHIDFYIIERDKFCRKVTQCHDAISLWNFMNPDVE